LFQAGGLSPGCASRRWQRSRPAATRELWITNADNNVTALIHSCITCRSSLTVRHRSLRRSALADRDPTRAFFEIAMAQNPKP
jgi:hypothetical protein